MTSSTRVIFIAWQSPTTRTIHPVARFASLGNPGSFEFAYVQGAYEAQAEGFIPFAHLKPLNRVFPLTALPPFLAARLMSSSREDFRNYVERLGLEGNPEPLVLLGRSEGRKVTDTIELCALPEIDRVAGKLLYYGFARGVRHVDGAEAAISSLSVGAEIGIEPDHENEHDPLALVLEHHDRRRLGFVPHTLLEEFDDLSKRGCGVRAFVERTNLGDAPVHQRLLVRFEAAWIDEFIPFSTPRFLPIAPDALDLRGMIIQAGV